MIRIVNEDNVFVFDEIGWGNTQFNSHTLIKTIVTDHFDSITQIEFYSQHNVICIRTINPNEFDLLRWSSSGVSDYWFRDINADLLNFLCKVPKFRRAVQRFFVNAEFPAFPVEKYPLLAAVLLGDNSQVDISE
jgi:hypothetical protein